MASKQYDLQKMLIPLPKYSTGPEASFIGWSLQVEAILRLTELESENVKIASLLNAIPEEILTQVFEKKLCSNLCLPSQYNSWVTVLTELRNCFRRQDSAAMYHWPGRHTDF